MSPIGPALAPSPFKGEGWGRGEISQYKPQVFKALTPLPASPLQGGGANPVTH